MRILIITQGISPVVAPLFRSHHEIVGIAEDGFKAQFKNKKMKSLWR